MNLCAAALIFSSSAQGQNPGKDPRYKQYAGQYGSSDGICLFEDGIFMLYGYATIVFGNYTFEKDLLRFTPDKQELFAVFAHKNPTIGDSTRIDFAGFERGETFVQFNKEKISRVFNEDANCFDGPFVYQRPGKLTDITLSQTPDRYVEEGKKSENSWLFKNDKGYNDFIFVYNRPAREYQDFVGKMKPGQDGVLALSNYGGDKGFTRRHKSGEGDWGEILQMKAEYYQSKVQTAEFLYANKHYKVFTPELEGYTFDQKTEQFVSKLAAENEGYFKHNQYKDDRYLRAYSPLVAATKEHKENPADKNTPFVFFSVCGEGSEKSYHYNGIIREDDQEDNGPIQTTAPVTQ